MNAHQRRLKRRLYQSTGWNFIGVQRRSGQLYDWDAEKSKWAIHLATGPLTRGVFLSVGSNDWKQS